MSTRSRGSLMSLVATNHFNTEIKLRNVAYEYDTFNNINTFYLKTKHVYTCMT